MRDFEGEIPAGQYGAGTVEIWDRGTYELVEEKKDGGLTVRLHGERLEGLWTLVPAALDGDPRNWLLLVRTAARRAGSYSPMLATSTDALPSGAGWAFEPKWDGFGRSPASRRRGDVAEQERQRPHRPFFDRREGDRPRRHGHRRPCSTARSAHSTRRDAPASGCCSRARARSSSPPSTYSSAMVSRCSIAPTSSAVPLLSELLEPAAGGVLLSPSFDDGAALEQAAREHGLEGVLAKRVDSTLPARPPLARLAQVEIEATPGAGRCGIHPRQGPAEQRDRLARPRSA